jgi:hypothetical protein
VSKHASTIVSKSLKNYNLFLHPTFWQEKKKKDIHLKEIKTSISTSQQTVNFCNKQGPVTTCTSKAMKHDFAVPCAACTYWWVFMQFK